MFSGISTPANSRLKFTRTWFKIEQAARYVRHLEMLVFAPLLALLLLTLANAPIYPEAVAAPSQAHDPQQNIPGLGKARIIYVPSPGLFGTSRCHYGAVAFWIVSLSSLDRGSECTDQDSSEYVGPTSGFISSKLEANGLTACKRQEPSLRIITHSLTSRSPPFNPTL